MQNTLSHIFSLMMVLISSIGSVGQIKPREELSIKLTSPDKPFRLSIGLVEGNIRIVTHTGNTIEVEAEVNSTKKDSNAKCQPEHQYEYQR